MPVCRDSSVVCGPVHFANEKAKRSFNEVHGYFTLRRNTRRYLLGGKAANVYPNRAAKYRPKRGSQNNVHAPQGLSGQWGGREPGTGPAELGPERAKASSA